MSSTKQKILIVEDEFIIANQIDLFLSSEGYTIVGPADNYDEAIAYIKHEIPDLIIADICLHEDMEAGIRISEFVTRNYRIPVIFLSGYSDKETISKAKGTNPNTFLIKPKPLDKAQLLATVQIALPNDSDKRSKVKAIDFKGKQIEILDNYDDFKEQERKENVIFRIDINEISFIETYNHHFKNTLLIHFINKQKGLLIREDIEEVQQKLSCQFIRVHKSYLVNMQNISGHKMPQYLLCKNQQIPVGDKHRNLVSAYINKHS